MFYNHVIRVKKYNEDISEVIRANLSLCFLQMNDCNNHNITVNKDDYYNYYRSMAVTRKAHVTITFQGLRL